MHSTCAALILREHISHTVKIVIRHLLHKYDACFIRPMILRFKFTGLKACCEKKSNIGISMLWKKQNGQYFSLTSISSLTKATDEYLHQG